MNAVHKALSGGFEKVWPDFVKHNWNRKPVDDYKTWDKLTIGAKETAPDIRPSTGTVVYNIKYELARLSAAYYRIELSEDDSTVVFWNGVTSKLDIRDLTQGVLGPQYTTDQASPDDSKGAHVTALIRMGESWTEEDWTNRDMVVYCRDVLAERVDELVLIISNSDFQDRDRKLKPPGIAPVVYTSNMGCWRWKGKATLSGGGTTASGDVTWTRVDAPSQSLIRYTGEGTMTWSVVPPQPGGCSSSGSVGLEGSTASLVGYNFVPPENQHSRTYIGAGAGPPVSVCGGMIAFPWMTSPPQPIISGIPFARYLQVSADSKTMDDSYSIPGRAGGWTWHFEAQRQ